MKIIWDYFWRENVIWSEYIYPASGALSLYGCILLFILMHASNTAAPFISDPELAAVGDVFGTWRMVYEMNAYDPAW